MKVALVYDRVNKWGGAERLLLALHRLFPGAPLFTSVYNRKTAEWAKDFEVRTSFLQKFPKAKTSHELYAFLMPIAFESFSFDEFDVVISVTSEGAKGIITKPSTLHICICLTPTRYLWSGYLEYFQSTTVRLLSKPAVSYLRTWDKTASNRPDCFIAISKTVQDRIKKYYSQDSTVIYPPVYLNSNSQILNSKQNSRYKIADTKYFLLVSRLSKFTPFKLVDLAIQAANKAQLPLKIVGSGDISYFKSMAGPTVEFLGMLTDEELSYYYKHCYALIFPGTEDFGLVMVEAQHFGKPVIAFRAGGATEVIQEGKTGEFFEEQSVDSLVEALEKFDPKRYNSKDCIDNSKRFSLERFEKRFKEFVGAKVNDYFK